MSSGLRIHIVQTYCWMRCLFIWSYDWTVMFGQYLYTVLDGWHVLSTKYNLTIHASLNVNCVTLSYTILVIYLVTLTFTCSTRTRFRRVCTQSFTSFNDISRIGIQEMVRDIKTFTATVVITGILLGVLHWFMAPKAVKKTVLYSFPPFFCRMTFIINHG